MRYPVINLRRQMGVDTSGCDSITGMLDKYNCQLTKIKDALNKVNPSNPNAYGTTPTSQPPPPPPPTPTSAVTSATAKSTPVSRPDTPTGGAPPISVHAGEEVPPPFPVLPPGTHAPIATGIRSGPYAEPPPAMDYPYYPRPVAPGECAEGYSRTVPGGPCRKNVATDSGRPPVGPNYTAPLHYDTTPAGGGKSVSTAPPQYKPVATGGASCPPGQFDPGNGVCRGSVATGGYGGGGGLTSGGGGGEGGSALTMTSPGMGPVSNFAAGMGRTVPLRNFSRLGAPAFAQPIKVVRNRFL